MPGAKVQAGKGFLASGGDVMLCQYGERMCICYICMSIPVYIYIFDYIFVFTHVTYVFVDLHVTYVYIHIKITCVCIDCI